MGWAELGRCVAGARARLAARAAAPRAAQEALLRAILQRHAACAFGRQHGFATLPDLRAFQQAVPAGDAESLAPWVEAMADGETGGLVDEPLQAFERTGGSTGGARLIPYTASGLACQREGLHAWLDDLGSARPAIRAGRSYWSISPAARAPTSTAGGVRIGMASDAEYFGAAAAPIVSLLAVPAAVAALPDIGAWRAVTLQALLADASLSLVSVWSPTFWLELCRHAVAQGDALCAAIAAGRWAVALPAALQPLLPAPVADPARAALVRRALASTPPDWATLWPRLALLSCWTHASAEPWALELAREFPQVEVQGKGLLATEGLVSLPLCDGGDPVAALSSTVLEFDDGQGRALACDEVTPGGEYEVLMTTSAGLYRYRLGDRVRVTGWWHGAPRLRLLGRSAGSSDLCGEKLTEAFVMACWRTLPDPGCGRLVPQASPRPHYRLLLDAARHDDAAAATLVARLDLALRDNPQWAYARDLGQLGALVPQRVPQLAARLQAQSLALGQRLGDGKPAVLGRLGEPGLADPA